MHLEKRATFGAIRKFATAHKDKSALRETDSKARWVHITVCVGAVLPRSHRVVVIPAVGQELVHHTLLPGTQVGLRALSQVANTSFEWVAVVYTALVEADVVVRQAGVGLRHGVVVLVFEERVHAGDAAAAYQAIGVIERSLLNTVFGHAILLHATVMFLAQHGLIRMPTWKSLGGANRDSLRTIVALATPISFNL